MFKKFIQRIIEAESREEAIQKVFYGVNGIDLAFQKGKISLSEYQMLMTLINRIE